MSVFIKILPDFHCCPVPAVLPARVLKRIVYICAGFVKLADLKKGQTAEITAFDRDDLKLRFYEMGCLPGERVTLELVAPLGDPIAIDIGGYILSLRKQDARYISVKLV